MKRISLKLNAWELEARRQKFIAPKPIAKNNEIVNFELLGVLEFIKS